MARGSGGYRQNHGQSMSEVLSRVFGAIILISCQGQLVMDLPLGESTSVQ